MYSNNDVWHFKSVSPGEGVKHDTNKCHTLFYRRVERLLFVYVWCAESDATTVYLWCGLIVRRTCNTLNVLLMSYCSVRYYKRMALLVLVNESLHVFPRSFWIWFLTFWKRVFE